MFRRLPPVAVGEEMVERYALILHAYVLMGNHYHLLIETPEGNASRALQWLNVSYAVWHNIRQQTAGAVFQARYKSIPVQADGRWALACCNYIHLNPVRISALGLSKEERAREKAGVVVEAVDREMIRRRLGVLRSHRWSSFPAYAGTAACPEWLTRDAIWQRVAGTNENAALAYRKQLEGCLRQGLEQDGDQRLTDAVAIGNTGFIRTLRKRVVGNGGDRTNVRAWKRLLPFKAIVHAVETLRGRPWQSFADTRGDWGRDMALYVGRLHAGLTLVELANETGMRLDAVSKAAARMRKRVGTEDKLRKAYDDIRLLINSVEA